MKNIEEKIKEIRELCHNLDEYKITNKITIIYQDFSIKSHFMICINGQFVDFDISLNKEYNELIAILKENQKQPELYTLDEIENVFKMWKDLREDYNIKN